MIARQFFLSAFLKIFIISFPSLTERVLLLKFIFNRCKNVPVKSCFNIEFIWIFYWSKLSCFGIRMCFQFAFISFIINENFHIQVGTQNSQCNLLLFFFEPFVLNQELSQLWKKPKKNEEYREEYFNLTLFIN